MPATSRFIKIVPSSFSHAGSFHLAGGDKVLDDALGVGGPLLWHAVLVHNAVLADEKTVKCCGAEETGMLDTSCFFEGESFRQARLVRE